MELRNVIWTPVVKNKLTAFSSDRFTSEEKYDFISQLIMETEDILKNPVIGKTYTEQFGKYKGISRIVVRKLKIYFK